MEVSTNLGSDRTNIGDQNETNASLVLDLLTGNNFTTSGAMRETSDLITTNISLDYTTSLPRDDNNTSQLLERTTEILDRLNSTLITNMHSFFSQSTTGITDEQDNSENVTTVPPDKPRFSSMQIWFIITGSIILAVIVLFCINTCIQCKLFDKIAKSYKRRNQMADLEKRSHRDRDAMYGTHNDHINAHHTHLFLHVHPNS